MGCVAGIVPWLVIGVTFAGSVTASDSQFPTFVIYIYASIFVFFNLFVIDVALQCREVGPWREYLFGERVYVLSSLVAKSVLAWQVYFGRIDSPI